MNIETIPDHTHILIPSYKSAALLSRFIDNLLISVPRERICVVDDCSQDNTPHVCRLKGIFCLSHNVNKGKGAALVTGFKHLITTGARWIITMDADGQHAVKDLPLFYKAISDNPDAGIIIGARSMKPGDMPPARIFSNRTTSFILSTITGTTIRDSQCGYRLYAAAFLKRIVIEYQRFEMESEVILKAAFEGFPIRFIPVQTLYLDQGSHISHLKDTIRWVKAVLHVWRGKKKKI